MTLEELLERLTMFGDIPEAEVFINSGPDEEDKPVTHVLDDDGAKIIMLSR
jgi:hypothetical protein